MEGSQGGGLLGEVEGSRGEVEGSWGEVEWEVEGSLGQVWMSPL